MFARNISVHLKSTMLSDDTRTFKKDIFLSLRKHNGIRKLMVGGMMLGLLTGACFAQRAAPSARPAPNASPMPSASPNPSPVGPSVSPVGPTVSPVAPSSSPVPTASPVTPNVNTVGPDVSPVDPNVNTVAPSTNPVGPKDMVQKPPIPPNTVVSPDAAPLHSGKRSGARAPSNAASNP
jgi:hypothetical protein